MPAVGDEQLTDRLSFTYGQTVMDFTYEAANGAQSVNATSWDKVRNVKVKAPDCPSGLLAP